MAERPVALLSPQGEAIPKAVPSLYGERAGNTSSSNRVTGQAVEGRLLSTSANSDFRPLRVMAVMAPQLPRTTEKGQMNTDGLWLEFFSDPSQWWDNRSDKRSPRSPDFRHKRTKEVLWIDSCSNPPWLKAELAAMIQGQAQFGYVRTLCQAGKLKEALLSLNQQDISADHETYVCLFQECIKLRGLAEGKQVHAHIIQSGFQPNAFLLNNIINMYARCGSLVDARQVFDEVQRDTCTWNIMITGYAKHGCAVEAFELYDQMIREGVTPNNVTFICVLNVCASLAALEKGKEVHAYIMKVGIPSDIILETALVNMFAKCGCLKDARQVFDNMAQKNVVSWNTMIAGYAQHWHGREASEVYEQMRQEGVIPNKVTFICIVNACASLAALEKGEEVHADIMKAGILSDTVLETALVDMYAKCGSTKDARKVFDHMAQRDVVSWNAMIAGYAKHGCGGEAFELYEQMMQEGVSPNKVTFLCVLKACTNLAGLDKGKEVHADIIKAGISADVILGNTLVDMYANSGSLRNARQVFDNMGQRDVVSWNSMMAGYGQHGCGRDALELFEQMEQEGFKADDVSFVSVLSACSHVGLVDEGCHYFSSMSQHHGLTPTAEHFGCMVDLLGRAGQLDEAENFINSMPIEPRVSVWRALLGACRIHDNVAVAERATKFLLKLDPQDAATYVLLSNIYAAAGRWDDTAKVRKMMQERGIQKKAGCCCIEVNNQVHTFIVDDKLHPQIGEIHAELKRLYS